MELKCNSWVIYANCYYLLKLLSLFVDNADPHAVLNVICAFGFAETNQHFPLLWLFLSSLEEGKVLREQTEDS